MKIDAVALRSILYKRGISQGALAEIADVHRNTVSNLCRGCSCAPGTARRIADALGVSLDAITENTAAPAGKA